VLFDGVCNLCNGSVLFIVARDPEAYFRFAPLQSETGRRLLVESGLIDSPSDSIVLIQDGQGFTRSRAALEIVRRLRFPWSLFYALILIPPFLRDKGYDLIARNRYRWFGKRDVCMTPTPELRSRFLE